MFKILSTCKGGGYMYCRTDPEHPKANAKGLYPLHRILIENKIGRLLNADEQVHHINGNKSDNRLRNLKLLTISEHTALHHKKVPDVMVNCPFCGIEFGVRPNLYRLRKKRNKSGLVYCSLSCSTKAFFVK